MVLWSVRGTILLVAAACFACDSSLPSCSVFAKTRVSACVTGPDFADGEVRSVVVTGTVKALSSQTTLACVGQGAFAVGGWMGDWPVQTIDVQTETGTVWTLGIAADASLGLTVGDSVSLDASREIGYFQSDTGHVLLRRGDGTALFVVAEAPTLLDVHPWVGVTLGAGSEACEDTGDCGTVVGQYLAVAGQAGETAIRPGSGAQVGNLRVTNAVFASGKGNSTCTDWNPSMVKVAVW